MEFFIPCPKIKRIKLSKHELDKLKREKWLAQGKKCADCGLPIPLKYSHLAHIKSRGAGGDDSFENTEVKHWDCHLIKDHGPRWSKLDEKDITPELGKI